MHLRGSHDGRMHLGEKIILSTCSDFKAARLSVTISPAVENARSAGTLEAWNLQVTLGTGCQIGVARMMQLPPGEREREREREGGI